MTQNNDELTDRSGWILDPEVPGNAAITQAYIDGLVPSVTSCDLYHFSLYWLERPSYYCELSPEMLTTPVKHYPTTSRITVNKW